MGFNSGFKGLIKNEMLKIILTPLCSVCSVLKWSINKTYFHSWVSCSLRMSLLSHPRATEMNRSRSVFLFYIRMYKPQTQNLKTSETSMTNLIQEDEYRHLLWLRNSFHVFRYDSFIFFLFITRETSIRL